MLGSASGRRESCPFGPFCRLQYAFVCRPCFIIPRYVILGPMTGLGRASKSLIFNGWGQNQTGDTLFLHPSKRFMRHTETNSSCCYSLLIAYFPHRPMRRCAGMSGVSFLRKHLAADYHISYDFLKTGADQPCNKVSQRTHR